MKLSAIVVIAFFIMVSAIILTVGYSQYDPTMKEVASWVTYRDNLIAAQREFPKAVQRELDAEKKAKQAVDAWNAIAATRTLPDSLQQGGIDLSMNELQLALVVPTFRNNVQKAVNDQVKVGGVKVVNGPVVPLPPSDPTKILLSYFNYPGLPPVVIFDLGAVTVQGTYQQITDNVEAWSRMPHYLAVSDGLRLQGTSPLLTGTYSVSIVGFLQTDPTRPIYPAVPPGGQLVTTATTPAGAVGTTAAATGLKPPTAKPAAGPAGAAGAARVPVRTPTAPGATGGARVPVRTKGP